MRAGNIGETRQQRFRAHAVRRLREAAGRKGKIRNQCHIELTAGFEHAICFRCSMEQAVVDLIGGERNASPGEVIGDAAHLVGAKICNPNRACLAGLHRFDEAFGEDSHVHQR